MLNNSDTFLSQGEQIRYARKKKCMTQEDVAKLIDINRSFVGLIETGKKEPSLKTLLKLANTLEVPIDLLAPDKMREALNNLIVKEKPDDIKRRKYFGVVDKAIKYDITPEELAIQLEAIRQIKEIAQQ